MTSFPPTRFQKFDEPSNPQNVAPRLKLLREKMAAAGVDGYLVPRADVHRGEMVPASEERLSYVTGFTGSAGVAVIGEKRAALFVDGRYTLQAPSQTDTTLVEVKNVPTDDLGDWIKANLPKDGQLGFDPWLHTPGEIKALRENLDGHMGLRPMENLVDAIWADRPAPPMGQGEILGMNRAGQSATDKITELQNTLKAAKADSLVLTLPESICWLFNIRGRDVPNTPFILGFAIVPTEGIPDVFVAGDKFSKADRQRLAETVNLHEPDGFAAALETLGEAGHSVWVDPSNLPTAVSETLTSGGAKLIERSDPVLLPKSKKNASELAGMREAHERDGVAMAKFLCWLDAEAPGGTLTEIDIVTALEAYRREDDTLVDISFETISGAGPNAALPHYRVNSASNRTLKPGELMLVDSGGQYLNGTTDITRTMATGPTTAEQRDCNTRVLKGMIGISRLSFPKGTNGAAIDIIARHALWQVGLNFNHGTGHGVGAFLSVHEGPIGISPRYPTPFAPGMIVSNEPGFYKEGDFGIRIENLIYVVEDPDHASFMRFETLTLCPIDVRLIDRDLLDEGERDWLNTYHARVRNVIGPKVSGDVKTWLEKVTQPI